LDRAGWLCASFANIEEEGRLQDLSGPGNRIATRPVPSCDSAKPFQTSYNCLASFAARFLRVIPKTAIRKALLERSVHPMNPHLGAGRQLRELVQLADGGHYHPRSSGLIDTYSLGFRGNRSKHYESLFREKLLVRQPVSAL
jgi:hypothetical protein